MTGGFDLALSASGPELLCALRTSDGSIVPAAAENAGRRGAAAPAVVAEVLANLGYALRDLRSLRVDVGPGSYTGLRVAVTFARFATRFGGGKLERFTTFELLAVAAGREVAVETTGSVRVVLDARRGRVFTALLGRDTSEPDKSEHAAMRIQLQSAPAALELQALSQLAVEDLERGSSWLIDPELEARVRARLPDDAATPVCRAPTTATARDLFDPGLHCVAATAAELEPLYLMGTYADTPHAGEAGGS